MKTKYFIIVMLIVFNVVHAQTTYYVDAEDGDDNNSGTTELLAWQNISEVNSATFSPGDQILFKSGQTFYGKLIVPSNGDISNQITFGKYGGDVRPIINGSNYTECIRIWGKEYLTFNDLELINNSDDDTTLVDSGANLKRYGIFANAANTGTTRKNLIFNNLKIHSIYPSTANGSGEYNGNGILMTSSGTAANNYFDGITIENCEIFDVGILGVAINKWVNNEIGKHENVTLKNNYIHHTGGSGAVFFEVDGYLFEDNLFTYTGDYSMDLGHSPSRQRGRGSGFWCVRTLNGILQYNEFSHAQGPKDSCGAHIDIGNYNVIVQYNLSYDNAGGFAEFMGGNTFCIYRYNISINDGWRVKYDSSNPLPEMYTAKGETNAQVGSSVWFSNYGGNAGNLASTDNQVYNNTFYIGKHVDNGWEVDINAFIEFEDDSDDNEIKNNIFYVAGSSSITYSKEDNAGAGNVMDYNMYNSNYPTVSYFQGANDISSGWPLFANVGGLDPDDYRLAPCSPAIDAGELIGGNGGEDYYGNLLTGNIPTDIGAHETLSCGDTNEFDSGWSSYPPTSSDLITIKSNYDTSVEGSFEACQLIVNSGKTLTISAGDYVKIYGSVCVLGTLIIEHEGSLVQEDDTAIFKKTNSGSITVEKITTSLEPLDFTILGSPMTEATREVELSVSTLVKYHDTSLFNPNTEVTDYDSGAENFADDNGDNWINHTGLLIPGEGYLVRPASGGGTLTTTYNTGTLNNGVITYTAIFGDDQNDSPNILSNPYASAIRIDDFLTNNSNAGGTVYFWEHITEQGTDPDYPGYQVANYDMGDISSCNGTGGLASANGGSVPTNLLPSGQGFAIKASGAGVITFNNALRSTGPNTGYRKSETAIDRLYLGVSNSTYGLRGQTLIGFTELATDGFDQNYDSKRLATPISLYSLIDERELGIQGRSVFHVDHIIPLGFTTHVAEDQEYKISIGAIEGILLEQATVHLKDNLLNTMTNLSETDYSFTSNEGHQIDRFELVFTEEVLGNQDVEINAISIYPNPTQNILNIISPLTEITDVEVFDVRGRIVNIIEFNDQGNYQVDVTNLESAMYFIKIKTNNGMVTKRIIKE